MSKPKIKVEWMDEPNKEGYWYRKEGRGCEAMNLVIVHKTVGRNMYVMFLVEICSSCETMQYKNELLEINNNRKTQWAFACPSVFNIRISN